jgi:peroxiredoxin
MRSLLLIALLASLVTACSHPAPTSPERVTLTTVDGGDRTFREVLARAPFTVVVFIAKDCPCLHAHLDRLRTIAATYAPRGVQFVAVDSEVGATPERAAEAQRALDLPFPVLVDAGAELANAFGASYATFTVIVGRDGNARYRGGIDSDKRKLHETATPYVRDALEDLLAGREVRRTEGKALGCVLRKW